MTGTAETVARRRSAVASSSQFRSRAQKTASAETRTPLRIESTTVFALTSDIIITYIDGTSVITKSVQHSINDQFSETAQTIRILADEQHVTLTWLT